MTPHAPQRSTHGAGPFVVIGTVEQIRDVLCGPQQHNQHCGAWRWHLYMQDNDKRLEAVRAEARKIIAARRAIEDEAELARELRKESV